MKKLIVLIILLGLVAAGSYAGYRQYQNNHSAQTSYRTAKVTRGDLTATIAATGTLQPEEVIDVGAQVAGLIISFGKDADGRTIDYGSTVEEGMVLARIDDSLFAMDVQQQTAGVDQANASIKRAQADLQQLKARGLQAQRDWERAQRLGPSEALSQVSYDAYEAAYESAKSAVGVGEAAIAQAEASLQQAKASLARAQRNLGYTVIKSPVRGTIIDRRVNIGQTVVSSLNAPSLFLIAKDLKRMQLWISVNEADIGEIRPGQRVTFAIDAFPGETFIGQVSKVRLNATMTQNVVTYTVEVTTDNSSGRLLPYLTASARFQVGKRENVLMVPNAALRYSPPQSAIAPVAKRAENGAGATTQPRQRPAEAEEKSNRGEVWVQRADGLLEAIRVTTGMTDGTSTQVQGENLAEGTEVVIGEAPRGSTNTASGTSPFMPQFPGGRRGRS